MILNSSIIENKYKCNKNVMEYLVFTGHFPILGIEGDTYYFADSALLREYLKDLPLHLKLLSLWVK
jgi:hypothetical protein